MKLLKVMLLSGAAFAAGAANAEEITFTCHYKCEGITTQVKRFEAENPGISVVMNIVPYEFIINNLPVQLAAGEGPDLSTGSDLAGLAPHYLDLSPYVDTASWEEAYGSSLAMYRVPGDIKSVNGMQIEFTITGAYINNTLFEQAGVEIPGNDADWDTWVNASKKVAEFTDTAYPVTLDRSGHRISGPAISYGSTIFDENGDPTFDDAYEAFAEKFVAWNQDDTIFKDVWAGTGGNKTVDAQAEFIAGKTVFFFSGSWQVSALNEGIGDGFDWSVVGSPCGDGGCSGMPGGAGVFGYKYTKHPEAVAKLIDFLASDESYAAFSNAELTIPANLRVAAAGLEYPSAGETAAKALNQWGKQVSVISPVAFQLLGNQNSKAFFNIGLQRVTQAIVGELTVAEAMERARSDLTEAIAESAN